MLPWPTTCHLLGSPRTDTASSATTPSASFASSTLPFRSSSRAGCVVRRSTQRRARLTHRLQIHPSTFGDVINDIDEVLIRANSSGWACFDNALAVMTLWLSPLLLGTKYTRVSRRPPARRSRHPADAPHSAQEMAALRALLASANRETFNPAGLNIRDPAESAFLFLEVRRTRQTRPVVAQLTLRSLLAADRVLLAQQRTRIPLHHPHGAVGPYHTPHVAPCAVRTALCALYAAQCWLAPCGSVLRSGSLCMRRNWAEEAAARSRLA